MRRNGCSKGWYGSVCFALDLADLFHLKIEGELTLQDGMANCGGWSEEPVSKEKQRPPIYNPEDYATSLKKWGKKIGTGSLYDMDPGQDPTKARTLPTQGSKDFRNPCLSLGEEMSLRQFGTPSELLTKLRADLRLSFPSFVQEFAGEPLDGVTLLLELLRNIQLSQTGETVRGPPAVRRRPLLDELACLFLVGMLQSGGGSGELQTAGLAFINALLSSAPSPQRKLYIQAELEQAGFDIVTLKKIVMKLPSTNEQVTKEIESYEKQLIDIDTLNEKANEAVKEKDDLRHKLDLLEKRVKILQEEKGILLSLEKCLQEKCCELQEEVSTLRSEHGNSNRKKTFVIKKKNSAHKNRDESSPPEDEGISSSERSLSPEGDPQRESMVYEVFNIKNETYDLMRNKRPLHKKLESTKKTDLKLKSSDEDDETTIDEVIQELRNIVNHAESEQYVRDRAYDDRSRCNDDSEISLHDYQKHKTIEKEDSITSTRHSIQIKNNTDIDDDNHEEEEAEIVPSKILPHPPRKAKSLIHLFVPPVEHGLLYSKAPDIQDENFYSSDEGSDSLLSASRCQNNITKKNSTTSFDFKECRAKFDSAERNEDKVKRSRTRSREEYRMTSVKRSESFQNSEIGSRQREYIDSMFYESQSQSPIDPKIQTPKCNRVDEIVNLIESKKLTKSLDRIDEGLNSMVNIIMTNEPKKSSWHEKRQRSISRTNSEAGNESPLIPFTRSNNRVHTYNSKSSSYQSKDENKEHKLLPTKLSSGSFDTSTFNHAFIMKRGSTAGLYSGTHILRDAPASMTSLVMTGTHSYSDLKKTVSSVGSSSNFGLHKVTDMPSGLY
ncbi:jg16124 [Pararge aegeria aegeria]|uniref:Jg16124 protein n=2 Tax=Pararge aegeria TaxID=116150 RepID=A0A8S4RCT4_9NEOP|nr:jg16124 [Pararge aegeria aegeria]